jgi:hypothetical protein
MQRFLPVAVGATLALAVGIFVAGASAGNKPVPPPTGERAHAQSVLESVFNAENYGEIGYINTPNGTQHPVPSNPKSWSPIFVVEYPKGSTINTGGTGATGPLSCWHMPTENCPSHGNALAGAAASIMPSVYGAGALGHDHVMDFHGADGWNVAWEPILVLFTNSAAANTRLLTETQIANAVTAGNAMEVPLPSAAFHCSQVSESVWALSTPLTG